MANSSTRDVFEFGIAAAKDEAARLRVIHDAERLIQTLENPGEVLARIGWGEPSRTAALRTAFELGLLTRLSDSPVTSTELASGTEADPVLVGEQ